MNQDDKPGEVRSNVGLGLEPERAAFEADAAAYDFDLTRDNGTSAIAPEPWSEYLDHATGHRWAGWLAARHDTLQQDAARFRLLLDGPHNFGVFVCGPEGEPDDSISNDELRMALDGMLGA